MKMSKRIFVCLMVLAIGVSMLAFGASASETAERKYDTTNHATILEYYAEPIVFDMSFEDATVGANYSDDALIQLNGRNQAFNGDTKPFPATIVEENGNKYLTIPSGSTILKQTTAFITWNAEEGKNIDDFLMSFSVKSSVSATGASLPPAELWVADTPATQQQIISKDDPLGTALIKFNFAEGKIVYYDGTELGATVSEALSADVFYDVSLVYSVINSSYSFTVTAPDGTVVASVSDIAIPYTTIGNVRIGSLSGSMKNSVLAFDNVSASGGSSIRYEADKVPFTNQALSDFVAICNDEAVSVEDKLAVVGTAFKLIYEYGEEVISDDNAENVLALKKLGVELYAAEVSGRLASLSDDLAYDERVKLIEECEYYDGLIPEDISFMDSDVIAAITAAAEQYKAEQAKLDDLKAHSEAIIAALADAELTNTNVRSYSYVKSYYDKIAAYTPYLGYPGIPEIIDSYNTVIAKYGELTESGNEFVENVLAASNTEATFGARYAAYVYARDNFFDDPAFPEIDTALAAYAEVDAEMTAVIALCDHFILNVSRADYSQYLSAKKSALDAASRGAYGEGEEAPEVDTQLNLIKEKYLEYPNIVASVELYESLLASVLADEAAATAYVNAVNELEKIASTLSKSELAAKIAEAEELQKTGNVIGVDGVTDANIILNELKAQLELSEGYKSQFSTVVDKLDKATAAEEIFSLAHEAYGVIGNAERYEGVLSADVEKLNAKVAEYNDMIKALNAGFKAANDVACSTVSASSGSPSDDTPVGLVATIIKKFYE